MASKNLEVNIDKSVYLLACKRKNMKKIRAELSKNPLRYKGSNLKEKWLGSVINVSGVKESSISTISERKYRIYNIINETIAIVEDSRLNRLGGLKCAKQIWELAILPSLLNSAETWPIQDLKIQKSLEDFQSSLYRGLLSVPKSCPLPSLTYESNSWLMKYRVYSKVLNFAKHIHCQNEETNLSKQILTEQIANEWPGLAKQAISICKELNISGLFDPMVNKKQFKVIVKRVCKSRNEEELKGQIHIFTKMSALRDEVIKGNSYFFEER